MQIGGEQDFAYCTHFERWTEQKEHNMLSVKIFAVVTAILLSLKVCKVKTQQCRGQDSIPGKMLRGFSFQKIKETKPFECYEVCIHHIRCQSFNFVMSQNLCELNNCSKVLRWDDLYPDPNRYYFQVKGILQNLVGWYRTIVGWANMGQICRFSNYWMRLSVIRRIMEILESVTLPNLHNSLTDHLKAESNNCFKIIPSLIKAGSTQNFCRFTFHLRVS